MTQQNEISISLHQQQQQSTISPRISSNHAFTRNNNNNLRKASINALKNLLPVVQDSYRSSRTTTTTATNYSSITSSELAKQSTTRHVSVQCDLIDTTTTIPPFELAVWLRLPSDAVFLEIQTRRLIEPRSDQRIHIGPLLLQRSSSSLDRKSNEKREPQQQQQRRRTNTRSVVYLQEISVQTCELNEHVSRVVGQLAGVFASHEKIYYPKRLANLIDSLSSGVSLERLLKCLVKLTSTSKREALCEKLLKMRWADFFSCFFEIEKERGGVTLIHEKMFITNH